MPHTEVDEIDGLQWSKRLSEQELQRTLNSGVENAETLYASYKDHKCPLVSRATSVVCSGQTILRSVDPENREGREVHKLFFIGCSRYSREKQAGHMIFGIESDVNLPMLIQLFGVERAHIHQVYLNEIRFSWEDHTQHLGISNLKQQLIDRP